MALKAAAPKVIRTNILRTSFGSGIVAIVSNTSSAYSFTRRKSGRRN